MSSYKEKLSASESKAHHHNIATKILRDLTDLRSKVEISPSASRRWVWELIQNAKDVHINNKVKIRVTYNVTSEIPSVTFEHNGMPFTADNIRFLIEQISTKDRKKDEEGKQKATGRFGTGFLTTHLLSELVIIEAVAKEPGLEYRKFELLLDRSGFEVDQITNAVQTAKKAIENLDDLPIYHTYAEENFNTSFRYSLDDNVGINVANAGINDLVNCLPYTLAFVDEIDSVEISSEHKLYKLSSISQTSNKLIKIITIEISDIDGFENTLSTTIAVVNNGFTSVAIPVNITENGISFLLINEKVPRLFCDFPLIGTEMFPFPLIINSNNFNPTDPRDGVFLTSPQRANPQIEENKAIMSEAVELYFELLEYATANKWSNLYILAQISNINRAFEWLEQGWFKNSVLNPIRAKLMHSEIIPTESGELAALLTKDEKKYMWLPFSERKEVREKIWSISKHWFPYCLLHHDYPELWQKLSWLDYGKLTVSQLAEFIEGKKTLDELSSIIVGCEAIDWLNDFYSLLKLEEKEADIINRRAIFPNQNQDFLKKSQLSFEEGEINEEFKDILKLLGIDIRRTLADKRLKTDFDVLKHINKLYVIRQINSEVDDKLNNRSMAKQFADGFKKLLLWFNKHPEDARTFFPTLYSNKHLLYNDEEIMANMDRAEQLADLLTEFSVKNINDLRILITDKRQTGPSILPVTQEILVSMGISSLAEWQEAIQDKDLAALYAHESVPTTDMFVYAQSLIQRASSNIVNYLRTQPRFNLSQMEATAPTILAGIYKDGQPISIVTRPAYDGQVIIYYGSERDTLDYEASELWVDDGLTPRCITLGHILKTSSIKKFPI